VGPKRKVLIPGNFVRKVSGLNSLQSDSVVKANEKGNDKIRANQKAAHGAAFSIGTVLF
jgi:hypothetical protein